MVQTVQRTMVLHQLQFNDKVFDVSVVHVVFLLGQRSCMPVVCNDRCWVGLSAENCVGPTVAGL